MPPIGTALSVATLAITSSLPGITHRSFSRVRSGFRWRRPFELGDEGTEFAWPLTLDGAIESGILSTADYRNIKRLEFAEEHGLSKLYGKTGGCRVHCASAPFLWAPRREGRLWKRCPL